MYSRRLGCCQVEKFNGSVQEHPQQEKSGSGHDTIEDATDKWKFFDRMSFLKAFISNRQ